MTSGKLTKKDLLEALTPHAKDANISFLSKVNEHEAFDMLADAFRKDPLMCWVAGINDTDPEKDEKMYNVCKYMISFINYRIINGARGVALGIRDEQTSELVGCITVSPSSCAAERIIDNIISVFKYGAPPMDKKPTDFAPYSKKRLESLNKLPKARSNHMKDTKSWIYVQTIGVASAHQHGKGYGSRMLRTITKTADSLNIPVYLETESPQLESMYQHFGFATVEKVILSVPGDERSDAKLTMFLMRRDP